MEYPKIETLYERDPQSFKVRPGVFKNRAYALLKSWQFTEKIDGTNIRVVWKEGKMSFAGRTDNASLHAELVKWLYENVSPARLQEVFPDCEAVVYGEGYGAGIQKGSGLYSATKRFIVFDVLVAGKWWLNWENVCDVAGKLYLGTVPYVGEMTLEAATEMVQQGFPSRLNGAQRDAEGLVGRPAETLFDKKGARLILKLKTQDF